MPHADPKKRKEYRRKYMRNYMRKQRVKQKKPEEIKIPETGLTSEFDFICETSEAIKTKYPELEWNMLLNIINFLYYRMRIGISKVNKLPPLKEQGFYDMQDIPAAIVSTRPKSLTKE